MVTETIHAWSLIAIGNVGTLFRVDLLEEKQNVFDWILYSLHVCFLYSNNNQYVLLLEYS